MVICPRADPECCWTIRCASKMHDPKTRDVTFAWHIMKAEMLRSPSSSTYMVSWCTKTRPHPNLRQSAIGLNIFLMAGRSGSTLPNQLFSQNIPNDYNFSSGEENSQMSCGHSWAEWFFQTLWEPTCNPPPPSTQKLINFDCFYLFFCGEQRRPHLLSHRQMLTLPKVRRYNFRAVHKDDRKHELYGIE